MKTLKTSMLVLLSVIFAFTLVACGGDTTPSQTATPTATPEEKIDLQGRVIKIAAWWYDGPNANSDSGIAALDKQAEIEAKYNCKIEWVEVPYADYVATFTTTTLAGQPFADIVRMEYGWALVASANDQLTPMADAFDLAEPKVYTDKISFLGKEMGFDARINDNGGIFYNRDLIQQLGLKDPQAYYKEDNWNWDTFLEIAKGATKDTNNDGKNDSYGFAGWGAEAGLFFIASNEGWIADADTAKERLSDPNTIEALEFLNKLYNVDKVVKVKFEDVTDYIERNTFQDGDVAMTYGWGWQAAGLKQANINYGYVPFPKGPKATEYKMPISGGHAWFIPAGVKDAKIITRIYDELKDTPVTESYRGQDWMEQILLTQEDIDVFSESLDKGVIIQIYGAFTDYPYNTAVNEILRDKLSVSSVVEAYKQPAQASIDALLAQ
jgi:multiple sugar transport system substrate-binding protein